MTGVIRAIGRDGPATCALWARLGDGGAVGRTVDVPIDQAESALLLGGQLDRRGDRHAAVIANRRRASPGAVERGQVGTERGQDVGAGIPERRLDGRTGGGQALDCTHAAKDSRAVRTPGHASLAGRCRSGRPTGGLAGNAKIPATTYFPERLPSQYLRRWRA